MTLQEQKTYISNWLNNISTKFSFASFSYGYNIKTKSHVICVDELIYNDDLFDSECDNLYDNFENPNNLNIIFISANDKLGRLIMPSIEYISNSNISFEDGTDSYYKIGKPISSTFGLTDIKDIDLYSVSTDSGINVEECINDYLLAA